jgi:hypothetical protein
MEGSCSTGKLTAAKRWSDQCRQFLWKSRSSPRCRGFLPSRFHEQTAILGLWGDLWHGTTRRRTYRGGAGRYEQSWWSRRWRCCITRSAQSGRLHASSLLVLGLICSPWIGSRTDYATPGREASCLIRIAHVQRREAQRRELRNARGASTVCRACRVLRHQKVAC